MRGGGATLSKKIAWRRRGHLPEIQRFLLRYRIIPLSAPDELYSPAASRAIMLTLATAASAFMVSPAGLRVAQPAVNSPVMAMPGGVTGAVIGGAAVYAVDKLILNKESPKFNEDGSLAPVTKDDVTKAQKLWADSIRVDLEGLPRRRRLCRRGW